jgi:hypothetical protein
MREIIQSIRRLEMGVKGTRWLIAALLLVGFANLAGIAFLLLRP